MFKTTAAELVASTSTVPESFDAYQYLRHLRGRLRFILSTCAAAGALVLAISLVLPKQYTSTATLIIDPPPSMPMSRAYLDSLRSYELLASADGIFSRAMEKFDFRASKRRVLRVFVPRERILTISATLPEPEKAHAVAQFVAEEIVRMNLDVNWDRADRLRLVDPGIAPRHPDSPNAGLNVALAAGVALIASLAYLTLTFRSRSHGRGAHA